MNPAEEAAFGRDLLVAQRLAAALERRLRVLAQRVRQDPTRQTPGGMVRDARETTSALRAALETLADNANWLAGDLGGWDQDAEDAALLAGVAPEQAGRPVGAAYHWPRCAGCGGVLSEEICVACGGIGWLGDTLPRTGGPCPECGERGLLRICWRCEEARPTDDGVTLEAAFTPQVVV